MTVADVWYWKLQWAEEVMTSKDNKMFVSEDYKGLEAEIEVRKEGMLK